MTDTARTAKGVRRDDEVAGPGRVRPRRLRRHALLRDLVAETHVRAEQLIMPHFVEPRDRGADPIPSMPGILRSVKMTSGANSSSFPSALKPSAAVSVA